MLFRSSGAARGPFFCFQRRHCYDVLWRGDKIAGSAQRRTRHAVLQHGSIVLANRFAQQPTAVVPQPFDEAIGRLRKMFTGAFHTVAKAACVPGEWASTELDSSRELIAKYVNTEWTRRT